MALKGKFTELEHNSDANNTEEAHVCQICGKDFGSKKAVHGHMRMHGDTAGKRVRRRPGVHSSTKKARTKYDTVHENNKQIEEEDNEEEIIEDPSAVNNNEEFVEDLFETKKNFFDYDAEEIIVVDTIFQRRVEQNNVNTIEEGTEVDSIKESKVSTSGCNAKVYRCNECDKSFDTHQALGGHVASHNKHKKNIESGTGNEKSGPTEHRDHEQEVKEHKCSECGMTFETGQKLGGHKSKHYYERERLKASQDIRTSSEPPTSAVPILPSTSIAPSTNTINVSIAPSTNTNNVYVFDLNELPRIEDDVEGEGEI